MGSIHTWGALATILLVVECMVGVLVLLAISFGLWKGSEWVVNNTKRGFAFIDEKVAQGRELLTKYQAIVAEPFVRGHGVVAGIEAGWRAVRRQGDTSPPSTPESELEG